MADIFTIPALIGDSDKPLDTTFDVISPIDSKLLWKCSAVSVTDATNAVTAAQAAFPAWRDSTPQFKRDIFLKAAEIMESRADELAGYMGAETGASDFWARFNIKLGADILKDVAGRISSIRGEAPTTGDPDVSAIVFKEPYGVILAIAPW
jgi:acyl-CoA reductase-like NAD-dependent aldehyde dehydrogenase